MSQPQLIQRHRRDHVGVEVDPCGGLPHPKADCGGEPTPDERPQRYAGRDPGAYGESPLLGLSSVEVEAVDRVAGAVVVVVGAAAVAGTSR
jgi:hypothetical protein